MERPSATSTAGSRATSHGGSKATSTPGSRASSTPVSRASSSGGSRASSTGGSSTTIEGGGAGGRLKRRTSAGRANRTLRSINIRRLHHAARNLDRRTIYKSLIIGSIVLVLLILLGFFVLIPLTMKLFPNILVGMIYLNTERLHGRNYTDLASNGVNRSGRAFYLTGEAGKIGVWHVLPTTEPISGDLNQKFADVNHPVVVYFHGNYYDRTYDHRVELYNTLTSFGYNVVAFDYRGFGDSDGHPTDTGVTMDGRLVYNYVKQYSGNNTVIIWGHSLGTAIATRAVKEMSEEKKPPDGLVLEAPFSNLLDMFMTTWLSYEADQGKCLLTCRLEPA